MNDQPATTPVLRVAGLSKTFGHGASAVHAVQDATFDINKGQIVAIVGESGSGKSTVSRLLLRLMPATSGTIAFNGKDVTHAKGPALKEYWRDVQAVFQDPFASFNQFFTVEKLLQRSLRLNRPSQEEAEELIRSNLAIVGLKPEDSLQKHPHQMSGGQRQRIMIARALMMRPKLLIADEATSMLDASLRVSVLNVLQDLRDELGMTVAFVTHDIGQACYLADRVMVMERGVLVEQGTTEQVIFDPQHEYTKRLLADVPSLA